MASNLLGKDAAASLLNYTPSDKKQESAKDSECK
jgi:hypothetical protein